jgi:predicted aminopeptidase
MQCGGAGPLSSVLQEPAASTVERHRFRPKSNFRLRGRHYNAVMDALAQRKFPARILAVFAALPLAGCATIGYYGQLARGELDMLRARRPIARVLDDPAAPASLKARLELAEQARAFASDQLGLPHNSSYTAYADLKRPYATWNVYAAPEFSVDALTRCYPLVGCLAYRGYFDRARADAEAARLKANGFDTWVGGAAAYSTLGWFADPILNTMLRWDDDELASTIFHELAHQQLFVRGDTEFNESFATFVQYEGLREWRAARGMPAPNDDEQLRDEAFDRLVLAARDRLRQLYASPLAPATMRARKHEEIERLRADYVVLRDTQWHGKSAYDDWINADINNAKLLPFGLYKRRVPAFAALFAQQRGDWRRFFAAVAAIARGSCSERRQALDRLSSAAPEAGAFSRP